MYSAISRLAVTLILLITASVGWGSVITESPFQRSGYWMPRLPAAAVQQSTAGSSQARFRFRPIPPRLAWSRFSHRPMFFPRFGYGLGGYRMGQFGQPQGGWGGRLPVMRYPVPTPPFVAMVPMHYRPPTWVKVNAMPESYRKGMVTYYPPAQPAATRGHYFPHRSVAGYLPHFFQRGDRRWRFRPLGLERWPSQTAGVLVPNGAGYHARQYPVGRTRPAAQLFRSDREGTDLSQAGFRYRGRPSGGDPRLSGAAFSAVLNPALTDLNSRPMKRHSSGAGQLLRGQVSALSSPTPVPRINGKPGFRKWRASQWDDVLASRRDVSRYRVHSFFPNSRRNGYGFPMGQYFSLRPPWVQLSWKKLDALSSRSLQKPGESRRGCTTFGSMGGDLIGEDGKAALFLGQGLYILAGIDFRRGHYISEQDQPVG